jgi:hypothetical protein
VWGLQAGGVCPEGFFLNGAQLRRLIVEAGCGYRSSIALRVCGSGRKTAWATLAVCSPKTPANNAEKGVHRAPFRFHPLHYFSLSEGAPEEAQGKVRAAGPCYALTAGLAMLAFFHSRHRV